MAPPKSSSIQGGAGGTRSRTAGSIKSSIRRSSRSSMLSNMIYVSTTEDEPESEAESSIDEHRRKDTEYHDRIQTEKLKKAQEKRAREKEEREREKQLNAARLAAKKKRKEANETEPSSESDIDNVNQVRRSPRKAQTTTSQPVVQVQSQLLNRMKRFSQLPQEIWEKRVQKKVKAQPSQEPEVDADTEALASQSPPNSSDGSKENVGEMETPPPPPIADEDPATATTGQSSKAKRVSTAASADNPLRASPRKKQSDDSFVNKALLTSTPYPGGVVPWKNGPSLPDPDMSPVTPQNKDAKNQAGRNVIHTQKVKTLSQPQSRIPVPLPVKLGETVTLETPPSSSVLPVVPVAQVVVAVSASGDKEADSEQIPSSPRRSPRKSLTFNAVMTSAAAVAPPQTAQKNGTFDVTHGFGGAGSRPKVVRTPVGRQDKRKEDSSITSSEGESPSPDQLPKTDSSRSKNASQEQGHAAGIVEKRTANLGARLRRSIQAAALPVDSDSELEDDDERVIPLPRRLRRTLSQSRPKPFDSPTVTTGGGKATQPSRLSKVALRPSRSRLSQVPQASSQSQSQGGSQQAGGRVDKNVGENEEEERAASAIHQSPTGRPEKSGLGLERRSKQHTTTATAAVVAEPSSESEEEQEQREPETQPVQKAVRSTRATGKAAEAEKAKMVEVEEPPVKIPIKRGRKQKVVAPEPPPPSSEIPAVDTQVDKDLVEKEGEEEEAPSSPLRERAASSPLKRGRRGKAVEAEAETKTVEEPPAKIPLKRGRKQKIVAPEPSSEIPAVDTQVDNDLVEKEGEEEEAPSSPLREQAAPSPLKRGRKGKAVVRASSRRATGKAVEAIVTKTVLEEPPAKIQLRRGRKKKVVVPAPAPPSEISAVETQVDNNLVEKEGEKAPSSPSRKRAAPSSSSPKRSPLTQQVALPPRRSPLTQRPSPSSPPKSASETEMGDEPPAKKFFKAKKSTKAKTAASLPQPSKSKRKPAMTLPVPKRGRPSRARRSKQKSLTRPPPSPVPQKSSSSSEDELVQEPSSQKKPRGRPRSTAIGSPSIPSPHHRGRFIPHSPLPSISASQPIPPSHHRARISIQPTSSQPLPGTVAAASRSMASHSSSQLSIRTKEDHRRRRSIFSLARAKSSSPPRKKKKKTNGKDEKTKERYVGSDYFGNYQLLKNQDFEKMLTEEQPNHGLDKGQVGQLKIRINHFLEDFFTTHCEETRQPYGFIPFGNLRTALEEQCLVEENCDSDKLLEEMKKGFPKEGWKKSEGILYPTRYSKKQDNDDYLFK